MSVSDIKLVTVIGGSGFIGRHVVQALAARGHRLRIGVRRPDLAGSLQPLGNVGQIMPVQVNVRYPASVDAACKGADAVINLAGVLNSSGAQSFRAVHVQGAEACAKAACDAGADTYIQFSAIGADENSDSEYARSKAEGENRARAQFYRTTIIRPSVVFGPDDDFFNRFAGLSRISPVLPLIGGGRTLFQPVYASDIGSAVVKMVDDEALNGKTYEFGGPETFTFRQLMEFVLKETGRKRLLVPVPWFAARTAGAIAGLLPKPLLTSDQVKLLRHDNIVSKQARDEGRTLEGLGVKRHGIEAIVPDYLFRYRKFGQYTQTGNSSI